MTAAQGVAFAARQMAQRRQLEEFAAQQPAIGEHSGELRDARHTDIQRQQRGIAFVTSNTSVIVPLLMGLVTAQYLYPRYGNGNPLSFALFIGTAMSVTAFPAALYL